MSLRIQTNIEAMDAHRNLVNTSNMLSQSMERLSSGYRINKAADDAAGLAISEKLQTQVSGLAQAQQNAQDAVSLVQTADGAMNEVQSMLQRVRDLAVEYNNGTLSSSDKAAITNEVAQLCAEIAQIAGQTKFNGIALLSGGATITFQVGADDGETVAVTGLKLFGSGSGYSIDSSIFTFTGATVTLASIDAAIDSISTARSTLGAVQNRLQHTLNNLATYQENLSGVGEPDQGRRHGVGDGQLHEAAGAAAGRHRDARAGEHLAAVGPAAAAVRGHAVGAAFRPRLPASAPRHVDPDVDSRVAAIEQLIRRKRVRSQRLPSPRLQACWRPRRRHGERRRRSRRHAGRRAGAAAGLERRPADRDLPLGRRRRTGRRAVVRVLRLVGGRAGRRADRPERTGTRLGLADRELGLVDRPAAAGLGHPRAGRPRPLRERSRRHRRVRERRRVADDGRGELRQRRFARAAVAERGDRLRADVKSPIRGTL